MSISLVLIPSDLSKPLEDHRISWDETENVNSLSFTSKARRRILSLLRDDADDDGTERDDPSAIDGREVPLLRPLGGAPGLFAHSRGSAVATPNVRATRLAMACGLLELRFYGTVVVARSHPAGRPRWSGVTTRDLWAACEVSPDLQASIQAELGSDAAIPVWLKNAAEQNYHDLAVVARMAEVMNSEEAEDDNSEIDDSDDDSDSDVCDNDADDEENDTNSPSEETPPPSTRYSATARSPLCLHCRRPTDHLCEGCGGAYFCPPPRDCAARGWSHACQCRTWKLYVSRREELSAFDYLDPGWQAPLVGRDFQLSAEPYREFLASRLMIEGSTGPTSGDEEEDEDGDESEGEGAPSRSSFSSWWATEVDGWAGGDSASARQVDIAARLSFEQGFAPVPINQLPPSRRVHEGDYERAGLSARANAKNAVGLWRLSSWEDYYRLRDIPPESPVALLCTFPLTIHRAIVEYGEVPVTVAMMLDRPLRVHVVGTEKELNFLDLFRELGFLLPEDLKLELVFVAREDMLPKKYRTTGPSSGSNNSGRSMLRVEMTSNLTVGVVGGTYGGEARTNPSRSGSATRNRKAATVLDPNFDCGSGPPDMVIAMNAGLYAYESWRSVINYLYRNKGVVGVFTDYNEYSGVHCAGLGGAASRESLCINPFRQPLAMPVYSMNLPQFSNGFFYVFNAQELD